MWVQKAQSKPSPAFDGDRPRWLRDTPYGALPPARQREAKPWGSLNHPKLHETTALKVEVNGNVIAVSLTGTAYRVLFRHRPDQSGLFQDAQLSVDKEAPMAHRDLEAIAWEAASQKARELGWTA